MGMWTNVPGRATRRSSPARESDAAADFNWPLVESLLPCGGIRIEDNVVLGEERIENLTRDAFRAVESGTGPSAS